MTARDRVLVGLLGLHAVMAWLALQAVLVFVELTWRMVAGQEGLRPLLATHLDQLRILRLLQAGLWLALAAVLVRLPDRARRVRSVPGVPGVARPPYPGGSRRMVWRRVLPAIAAVDVSARALAAWSGGPLDLGPAMLALVAAQLLTLVVSVSGIWTVLAGPVGGEA